ncbi:MAG: PilN domain-containing protein [Gemmatimonadaceae bacterium]
MIEINLLPGAGKKTRSRGPGVNLGGVAAGIFSQIKDPFLIGAVAAVIVAILAVGGMWVTQSTRQRSLDARLRTAEQDSIRYSALVNQKRKAEARRDSIVRQVELIRSFDSKRFIWPHVLDEVSRALPPYTWLTSITQTNVTQIAAAPAAPPPPAPDAKDGKGPKPRSDALAPLDSGASAGVQFRIVGNTVDIQALTRFMKLLEASPFIENVALVKSALVIVDGKEVTEFQLEASYQAPDPSAVRTVPVSLSVR